MLTFDSFVAKKACGAPRAFRVSGVFPFSSPRLESVPEPRDRPLGVIEALTSVRDQCPHAAVREHAERALDEIRARGSEAMHEQVFLVLSTIGGWRGDKAFAVKRALRDFLDQA